MGAEDCLVVSVWDLRSLGLMGFLVYFYIHVLVRISRVILVYPCPLYHVHIYVCTLRLVQGV